MTMEPTVVWIGPVARAQVSAPSGDVFIQCVGTAGTPICADTDLASVLPGKGVPADRPIVLQGFSAGGDAIKRFLKDPASRARTVAVVTHDATYQGFGSDDGFIAYGVEAANGTPGRIFVATASSPPGSNLRGGISDSASMDALRQQIETKTGKTFQAIDASWAPKPPVKALKLGNVVFLDFGTAYSHGEHATVLAVPLWNNVVKPLLDAPQTTPAEIPAEPDATPSADGTAPDHYTSSYVRVGGAALVGLGAFAILFALLGKKV